MLKLKLLECRLLENEFNSKALISKERLSKGALRNFESLVSIIMQLQLDSVNDLPFSLISKIAETDTDNRLTRMGNEIIESENQKLENMIAQKRETLKTLSDVIEC